MSFKTIAVSARYHYLIVKVVANRLKYLLWCGVFAMAWLSALPVIAHADLVVNEIMANEPGSETALEWIELFNSGSDTVILADYILIEGGDTSRFAAGVYVPAGGFVVLARKPTAAVGAASFEATWGDGSGIWGDTPEEGYPVISVKMSLRNAADTVTIVRLLDGYQETVSWSTSPPDGITLERINPNKPPSADNFGLCRDVAGSTPGRVNSLIPPDNNLTLIAAGSGVTAPPDTLQPIELTLQVANKGLAVSSSSIVEVFFDRDFSHNLSDGDLVDSIPLPLLLPDSTTVLHREYPEPCGRKHLIVRLPDDADSTDNSLEFTFGFGSHFRELVITEFVPNPDDRLDCEWLELKSVANYPVSAKGFAIGDTSKRYLIKDDVSVSTGQRLIVCEDTSAFRRYYGITDCPVVAPTGWRRLGNAGGVMIIESDLHSTSDSVKYGGSPTEGHSWERDEDSTSGAFSALFYQSTDSNGATPCRVNSPRALPPQNDIGFAGAITAQVAHDQDSARFSAFIKNLGYLTSLSSELRWYEDADFDSLADESELLDAVLIPPLTAGDSLVVEWSHAFSLGCHVVFAILANDENLTNNVSRIAFSVGPLTREVIITEFLANPSGSLETEWVEIRNISRRTIDLADWSIGDSLHQYTVAQHAAVAPDQYAVLAQDSTAYAAFYGDDCIAIEPANWASLNNSGDGIYLRDCFGVMSDSVSYSLTGEDNHSTELNELQTSARSWYVSTSPSGSTPCARNSVSSELSESIDVAVRNRVFAPRQGEKLCYHVSCPPGTVFVIEVFDLAGRRHCTVASSVALSSGDFCYDGLSDSYGTLPPGAYILSVEVDGGNTFSRRIGFAVADGR